MALDFPANPSQGAIYRYPDPINGPTTYTFNGTAWVITMGGGGGGGDVTNVLGVYPILSNESPPEVQIAIDQKGINTSEINNDAQFIGNPTEDLVVTEFLSVGDPLVPGVYMDKTGDMRVTGDFQVNMAAMQPLPPD